MVEKLEKTNSRSLAHKLKNIWHIFEFLNYLLMSNLLTIKEASLWATNHIGKNVTPSNIAYLIQYGRIKKNGENGSTQINLDDLRNYYKSYSGLREVSFRERLGDDLNWALSFEQYKEAETTKHVHRLHPYKGKFIPQLVEYFLDEHTDSFKAKTYFTKGDIVLDPFSGSGTTMVQSCELGIHAIGVDISAFNTLIGNCKIAKYNIYDLQKEVYRITKSLGEFIENSNAVEFEEKLLLELNKFNSKYFPVPEYKYKLRQGEIDEKKYGTEKETLFLPIYEKLLKEYNIKLKQVKKGNFLDKWYSLHIRNEIDFIFEQLKEIKNTSTREIVSVILSRTIRSCRATTHADLATLLEPVITTYYCSKHGKICKPLFSIMKWWKTYSKDTINRLQQFDKLRTNTYQLCLTGDSRNMDIFKQVKKENDKFGKLLEKQKIKGIFSSPPYVGLIDYHEQHAYAYDLFGFDRKDEYEIGPLFKGQTREAKQNYIQGISDVLNNCKRFLADDYDVFLVANDKYNMYPTIAENAGMQIINQFKRPVLNRTEKDKTAYSETVFHLKDNNT
jgi:DNA modification methylase